jgi:hypothetical protein
MGHGLFRPEGANLFVDGGMVVERMLLAFGVFSLFLVNQNRTEISLVDVLFLHCATSSIWSM